MTFKKLLHKAHSHQVKNQRELKLLAFSIAQQLANYPIIGSIKYKANKLTKYHITVTPISKCDITTTPSKKKKNIISFFNSHFN